MDIQAMAPIFYGVFLAELGDKTQLATLCFAAQSGARRLRVFLASGSALVLSTALGVLCGTALRRSMPTQWILAGAGLAFIVMALSLLRESFAARRGQRSDPAAPAQEPAARDMKPFGLIFAGVFLAELGDKTQIAAVLFSAGRAAAPWEVFLAASLALLTSTGLAVLCGAALARRVSAAALQLAAGLLFLALGLYYLAQSLAGPRLL